MSWSTSPFSSPIHLYTLTHVFDSSGRLLDGLLEDGPGELLDKRLVQPLKSRFDEGEGDVSGCGRKKGWEGERKKERTGW